MVCMGLIHDVHTMLLYLCVCQIIFVCKAVALLSCLQCMSSVFSWTQQKCYLSSLNMK